MHLSLLLQATPLLRSMSIPLPLLILHLLLRVIHLFGVCWILSWPFKRRMDRFCWMCSRSFKLCVLIWLVLDSLLHHLFLMMSHDCPLAICHKKGKYILVLCMKIEGDIMCLFLFLVSHCATLIINLYLWGYLWYISFILCYVKLRIYFVLLVFSTHAFMCLLSVTGIYRLVQLCCCLHLQLTDSS